MVRLARDGNDEFGEDLNQWLSPWLWMGDPEEERHERAYVAALSAWEEHPTKDLYGTITPSELEQMVLTRQETTGQEVTPSECGELLRILEALNDPRQLKLLSAPHWAFITEPRPKGLGGALACFVQKFTGSRGTRKKVGLLVKPLMGTTYLPDAAVPSELQEQDGRRCKQNRRKFWKELRPNLGFPAPTAAERSAGDDESVVSSVEPSPGFDDRHLGDTPAFGDLLLAVWRMLTVTPAPSSVSSAVFFESL